MNSEIAATLARFFDEGKGPSHDELNRLFVKAGIDRFDPQGQQPGTSVGKLKRVRGALLEASPADPVGSARFAKELVALLKARGCFVAGSEDYAGADVISAAQAAFAGVGLRLSSAGELLPAVALGELEGSALTEALKAYVRRIQARSDDGALTIGTAKDLVEAAARHVLVEATGAYDKRLDFPTTLYRACTQNSTATPTGHMLDELDTHPTRALEQALMLAAVAINRLRSAEGTGHGRPHPSRATGRQGRLAAQAAALVAIVLLPDLMQE